MPLPVAFVVAAVVVGVAPNMPDEADVVVCEAPNLK